MRINSHSHVFTLRAILSQDSLDMIQRRLREEIEPAWLGKAAAGLAEDILEGLAAHDEEEVLRRLLERLKKEAGYQSLLGGADIPSWLWPVLEKKAEGLALSTLAATSSPKVTGSSQCER
jgi:hypothetical protein